MGRVDKDKTFVGDTPARASEVNTVFDDIYNEFNGDIDEYNLNLDRPELIEALGDIFYPVGTKYTNFEDDTNPEDLLGFGTWERIAEGKVIVGVDEDDNDFDESEKTGGEKEHTLTENEFPEHDHGEAGKHSHEYSRIEKTERVSSGGENDYAGSEITRETDTNGEHIHSKVGGGEAHNNLQPYITAYIWKRTA